MSGLYTRANLSESGLNATEALQKLYEPQVQNDILLFAFSSSLRSQISSSDKIFGLLNEPLSELSGSVFNRTKILTSEFTFSDGSLVWFDRVPDQLVDKVKVSINGSVANLRVEGSGKGYLVRQQDGSEISSYPATISVNLLGLVSGSRSAIASITVNQDGTISFDSEVLNGGTGYVNGEKLQILLKCSNNESPLTNNCGEYNTGLYIDQVKSISSYRASIFNSQYFYEVKSSDRSGFFLYDNRLNEWVYFGEDYDSIQQGVEGIVLLRDDSISPNNISQLYRLNSRSYFNSYIDYFQIEENLSTSLSSILDLVESAENDLPLFAQNSRPYKFKSSQGNVLGIDYNVFSGFNFISDYRVIFRDPDSVLDQEEFDFFTIRDQLSGKNEYKIGEVTIPGIWIFSGEKYQRAFSTDDKPFVKTLGSKYLSPLLFNSSGDPLNESSQNKYSISGAFDSEINTLIQNIPDGFVYHRTLEVTSENNINYWPLLSYRGPNGSVLDAKFLAL